MQVAKRCLDGIGFCVIPKPANDHRPLALRHGPLSAMSALLIASKIIALLILALTPVSAELSTITTARIVQLTNAERIKTGLPALTISPQLTSAAEMKAQDMLSQGYFAHISPTGVTPWFWMKKVGYKYQVAGENLAIDFTNAEDVVSAWMASPTHKENMLLPDYTETGVAVITGNFQGGTSTIVVHMFGLPLDQPDPDIATVPATAPTVKTTPLPTPTVAAAKSLPPQTTPTPTPSPTLEPTPSPLPANPSPRPPRIAIGPDTLSNQVASLHIAGEPKNSVSLLINNQTQATIDLPANGNMNYDLPIASLPDGLLIIQAYETNKSTQQSSELSAPITFTKQTPQLSSIARDQVSFWLSPQTDASQALTEITSTTQAQQNYSVFNQGQTQQLSATKVLSVEINQQPMVFTATDQEGNKSAPLTLTIAPEFNSQLTPTTNSTPSLRLSQLTRDIAAAIFVAIIILLGLAVLIRIRIQHPALIAHASLVILIAAMFFFF